MMIYLYINLAASVALLVITGYAIYQWKKWEDAYWSIRQIPRNEEPKKTIVAPLYHSIRSRWND